MEQVEYLGRWVDKKHFAAFVYNESGEKLAKSYDEFKTLISSGLWFPTKDFTVQPKFEEKVPEPVALDEVKQKRERSKNQFRAATATSNLGK